MEKKKIYTVATSHLDTIWSWDFETTVSKYIYNTLVDNFKLFEKYPSYVFSFEGSYRYELMEEYYPELFEKMKEYIKDGRWNVTGSAFENGDVNCPSPEALFRNILFGNSYFDEKFNKRSLDIYLPDCFGFGWALPSVAVHANLCGFTTQKLAWGSAYGIPFDIGKWYGVDGNFVYASANPHDYYFTLTQLRKWSFVEKKLKENEKYGLDSTYIFHGIGDRGGAPEESSVKYVEEEIKKNDSEDIEIIAASADQIYRDINKELPQEVKDKLPTWNNELVMQNHGVGGYTSRAIGKRWNDRNQELADIAERSSVISSYFGVNKYNEEVFEKAWKRVIAHQFHDDTPGTSVQRAYRRSWNDYAMSINQFSGEIDASISALSNLMKSDFCMGTPLLVFNSIEAERSDAVIAKISGIKTNFVKVFDEKGKEVPSQILSSKADEKEILFISKMDSLSLKVYDVRESDTASSLKTALSISEDTLQNEKYIVKINKTGNITSIIDKEDNEREILDAPITLGLFNYNGSKVWPAWEMNYEEANKKPDRIPKIVSIKIAESGPARVAFEVVQKDKKSVFKSYICLTLGGKIVEVYNEIEWQSMRTMCKNQFSFTASNEKATFDLGLGAIKRENMSEKLFEVPAQKWADITDESGNFGVSIISECKHGWDKFSNNTLRLTAIHTPKRNYRIDSMQSMMDLGLNKYSFAIFSHKGEVGASTQMESKCFTTPMISCTMKKHSGKLGGSYSFGKVSTNDVIIRAIKKAHHSDDKSIIVRLNEGTNKEIKDFSFSLGNGIESATEVFASEEYKGEAKVENGKLYCDFKPYEIKSFSLKLKDNTEVESLEISAPIKLDYNYNLISKQNQKSENSLLIPREIIKEKITSCGTTFVISGADKNNALLTNNSLMKIEEDANTLCLLCASFEDKSVVFDVDGDLQKRTINSMTEAYARWDLYDFGETAYIKNGNLGFEATHTHNENGKDLFAKELYFWVVSLDVKKGSTVKLPNDLIILGATATTKNAKITTPLIEEIESNRPFEFKMNLKEKLWYINSKMVWMLHDKDNFLTHWNNGKNGKRVEQTGKRAVSRTVEKLDRECDK